MNSTTDEHGLTRIRICKPRNTPNTRNEDRGELTQQFSFWGPLPHLCGSEASKRELPELTTQRAQRGNQVSLCSLRSLWLSPFSLSVLCLNLIFRDFLA